MSTALSGHRRIDARSLALHRAIAGKLRANPPLIGIAHQNLDRWSAASGRSQPYWDAWREILSRPLEEILSVMVEDSEKMTAMRQAIARISSSSEARPFWALSPTPRRSWRSAGSSLTSLA